jgi:hypothetical protein
MTFHGFSNVSVVLFDVLWPYVRFLFPLQKPVFISSVMNECSTRQVFVIFTASPYLRKSSELPLRLSF